MRRDWRWARRCRAGLPSVGLAVAVLAGALFSGTMAGQAGAQSLDQAFNDGMAAAQRGDFATARDIWSPLAAEGHPNAQFNLGQMYARGDGVPQDFAMALHWYRQVADKGFAAARFRLGVMFERGLGERAGVLCAYMWYDLAAADGWRPAATRRDALAGEMTAAQVRWAQKMARTFSPDYPFCPDARVTVSMGF
ncbi:tetratricopeptide repeat protein [Roseospira visakhapatnamensis]|uniref:TPR repeat protein n=1 Tax=Roseospira visakhapatnamensis TaxID=390880 RepID=A0A7W6W9A1_9PROT|nr:tetratricopeptide repeat protein [Roseospira visakhapatnamensis]MBB4265895.1 TPR repeat protein [Roseospira visakhapatnamensis]